MDDTPVRYYVDKDIDRHTLDGHIQRDLDRGATVCIHFHKRDQECSDSCETRKPEVLHRNIFDQV